MQNRQEKIKREKLLTSFNTNYKEDTPISRNLEFQKAKLGKQVLEDLIAELGSYKKTNSSYADKQFVLDAINAYDFNTMREISNFFFESSGIYKRLCRYMAYLYRYDWIVTPYINESSKEDSEKNSKIIDATLNDFHKILRFFDLSELKRLFGEIALKVVKNGCYYAYKIPTDKKIILQELDPNYCRSRFTSNGRPVVEFNMRYFDTMFKNVKEREKILKIFPKEFLKGYVAYKKGELEPLFAGDTAGWYVLDPTNTIKFNVNNDDEPMFMSIIPAIIDLNEAQDLDKKRMAQKLVKIIIQKLPLDKNGDLIFDMDEAQQLHANASRMVGKAMGVDVLTTFADVDVADMADTGNTAAKDELEKVERSVYNEAGVSQMQFNTDGNIALEKSILNDEASLYDLIAQFEAFLNDYLEIYNRRPKKYYFRLQILTTTIYNYKEMSKLYKEQMQVGFSKMLPQIALGQSQSSILANAYFENEILDLVNLFIPPMMSSTMNSDVLNRVNQQNKENKSGESTGGRPEKADDEKSEKTIMNEESLS